MNQMSQPVVPSDAQLLADCGKIVGHLVKNVHSPAQDILSESRFC